MLQLMDSFKLVRPAPSLRRRRLAALACVRSGCKTRLIDGPLCERPTRLAYLSHR